MAREKQLVKAGVVKAGEEENPGMNKTTTCFAVAGGALATSFVDPTGASAVVALSSGAAGVCGLTYHGLRRGTHMVGNLVDNVKTAVITSSQQLVATAESVVQPPAQDISGHSQSQNKMRSHPSKPPRKIEEKVSSRPSKPSRKIENKVSSHPSKPSRKSEDKRSPVSRSTSKAKSQPSEDEVQALLKKYKKLRALKPITMVVLSRTVFFLPTAYLGPVINDHCVHKSSRQYRKLKQEADRREIDFRELNTDGTPKETGAFLKNNAEASIVLRSISRIGAKAVSSCTTDDVSEDNESNEDSEDEEGEDEEGEDEEGEDEDEEDEDEEDEDEDEEDEEGEDEDEEDEDEDEEDENKFR